MGVPVSGRVGVLWLWGVVEKKSRKKIGEVRAKVKKRKEKEDNEKVGGKKWEKSG